MGRVFQRVSRHLHGPVWLLVTGLLLHPAANALPATSVTALIDRCQIVFQKQMGLSFLENHKAGQLPSVISTLIPRDRSDIRNELIKALDAAERDWSVDALNSLIVDWLRDAGLQQAEWFQGLVEALDSSVVRKSRARFHLDVRPHVRQNLESIPQFSSLIESGKYLRQQGASLEQLRRIREELSKSSRGEQVLCWDPNFPISAQVFKLIARNVYVPNARSQPLILFSSTKERVHRPLDSEIVEIPERRHTGDLHGSAPIAFARIKFVAGQQQDPDVVHTFLVPDLANIPGLAIQKGAVEIKGAYPNQVALVPFGGAAGQFLEIRIGSFIDQYIVRLTDGHGKALRNNPLTVEQSMALFSKVLRFHQTRGLTDAIKNYAIQLMEFETLLNKKGYRLEVTSNSRYLTIKSFSEPTRMAMPEVLSPQIKSSLKDLILHFEAGPFAIPSSSTTEWADVPLEVRQVYLDYYSISFLAQSLAERMVTMDLPSLIHLQNRGSGFRESFSSMSLQWLELPERLRLLALRQVDQILPTPNEPLSQFWVNSLKKLNLVPSDFEN